MKQGKKENPLWAKHKPLVDAKIKELGAKEGINRQDIAVALNKAGLRTYSGRKWMHATVCSYGLKEGLIQRKVRTSAGDAGTTGEATRPETSSRRRRGKGRGQSEDLSMSDLEDVFTSSLKPALKLRIIKNLVK